MKGMEYIDDKGQKMALLFPNGRTMSKFMKASRNDDRARMKQMIGQGLVIRKPLILKDATT